MLGTCPDMPFALARKRRDAARTQLADGTDSSIHRKADKARKELDKTNTFEAVARRWLEMKTGSLSAGTHNKARWIPETFAIPHLGAKPLAEILPPDALVALRALEARGTLETMHRTNM